jgi:regulator of sigma E protease
MDTIFGYLHSGLSAIVPFVVLLGLLIFVHELGHFLVAKFFGVRVEVFSLGFGKKIFKYKKGDTTYALSLIPLGGYVKMFGDELSAEIPEAEKRFSFTHKPVLQRIAVVLAGPLMNFFFAIVIFFVVAMAGEQMRSPVVGDVLSDTIAYSAGFRSGDKILKAGNEKVQTWDQFQKMMNQFHDQSLQVQVLRENSDQDSTFQITPHLIDNPNILSVNSQVGDVAGLSNSSKAAVIGIKAGTIAAQNGLHTGDIVRSINGQKVKYFRELENLFVQMQDQPIKLEIERYEPIDAKEPQVLNFQIPAAKYSSMGVLGIESADLYLAKIMDGSPAMAAGLQSGDKITKIQGQVPQHWEDILQTVKTFNGQGSVAVEVDRGGKTISFQMAPKMTSQMNAQGGEEKRFTVGIVPWYQLAGVDIITVRAHNPWAGLKRGWHKTDEETEMTVLSFLRLIEAKISPKNIGGVISIGQAASETFKIGIVSFLQMMAVISINLFILNLLPIPVLDGGHLLFYTIEAFRGAPVSMRKMEIAQQIGLAVLMSLMAFALFNDFTRLLGSW